MKLILDPDNTIFATHSDDQDVAHRYPGMTEQIVPNDTVLDYDAATGAQTISGTQPDGWEAAKAELQGEARSDQVDALIDRLLKDNERESMGLPRLRAKAEVEHAIHHLHMEVTGTLVPGPHS